MEKPPIEDVLIHYGADHIPARSGWASVKCPFHEDRSASASVNTDSGHFTCFACDIDSPLSEGRGAIAFDSLDLIAWKEGTTDFPSTIEAAETIFGSRYGSVSEGSAGKSRRRVFGESGPKRGQRSALQARIRRRTFNRP